MRFIKFLSIFDVDYTCGSIIIEWVVKEREHNENKFSN